MVCRRLHILIYCSRKDCRSTSNGWTLIGLRGLLNFSNEGGCTASRAGESCRLMLADSGWLAPADPRSTGIKEENFLQMV